MIYRIYPNNKSNLLIIKHINRNIVVVCIINLQKKLFYIEYFFKIIVLMYLKLLDFLQVKHGI